MRHEVRGARPVLTFDLDGVLCRPPFGINPGRGRNKPRRSEGRPSIWRFTEPYRYLGRRPMPGAAEGVTLLSREYDCQVLTARTPRTASVTKAWLERHFDGRLHLNLRPGYEETPAGFKVRRIAELGAVAHFEDDPHTAAWLAEVVPAVFLVDWWRNRWLEGVENVHRIQRIAEAEPILASLGDAAAMARAAYTPGGGPAADG